MNIIGISGLAGSGKDTAADMILQHKGIVKVSLADPIKRFAKEMWDFSDDQLWGQSQFRNAPDPRYEVKPGEFLTPRHVLQHLGTEGARAIDYDVWIRYTIRIAKTLLEAKPGEFCYSSQEGLQSYIEQYPQGEFERMEGFPEKVKVVVIPDVRFKNEIQHIRGAGGIMLRVIRPGAGLEGSFALHQSEAEMADIPDAEFDIVIKNVGTLNDLKTSVDEFVTTLLHKDL